jgi:hypothetical protein
MALPPETSALRSLQAAFGQHLHARNSQTRAAADSALSIELSGTEQIPAAARLDVYRNNARYFFLTALERTYPVLHRRVGDDYFRQLAREYRDSHPSRCGDLHWIGREFPAWLAGRTAGTDYHWLSDLARLEWACECAWAAADAVPARLEVLEGVLPDALADVVLTLHPSTHCVASPYPLWSVWQANQGESAGPAVDLASGAEHCVVACPGDRVVVYRIAQDAFALLEQLIAGASLGNAVDAVDYDIAHLPQVLAWMFGEGLVAEVRLPG